MKKLLMSLIIVIVLINLFSCGSRTKGAFKNVDGKEIYMEGGNQVFDKLVKVGEDSYYIGNDGTKIKSNWAIIDNDSN